MATAGPMATLTSADILTLTQWLSPAYPVGGFAYSHGLEWAIDSGDVRTAGDVKAWISDVLSFGSGWSDSVFLVAAYGAQSPGAVQQIDLQTLAFCASSERLKESQLLGQAFCDVTAAIWSLDLASLTYPVAVGHAARLRGLPAELTTQMFLHSFMSNLAACATRLVPLGQTDSQRLVHEMTPLCAQVASAAQTADLDELSATSFLADIASMKHETQYSRMFRT